MSRDDKRAAWIAVFQENQRQLIEAHEEFQRTLSAGHKHFLEAMAESQRRLAAAIAGDEFEGVTSIARTRTTPAIVDTARPGVLWHVLERSDVIGIVPDEFGVGAHVVQQLKSRGWNARLLGSGDSADVMIFLGALMINERALAQGKGLEVAATWLKRDFKAVVLVGDLGGRFGFDQLESYRAVHIGLMDFVNRAHCPARFIDLDVGFRKPDAAAQDLVAEFLGGGGESPVGLPEDGRVHLVEIEAQAVLRPRSHEQETLLIVSSQTVMLDTIREFWSGKIAGVGFTSDALDIALKCDLFDPMSTYEAVDSVRRICGPFTHILLMEPTGDWPEDRAFHALAPFHAILASTAADPVQGIMARIVRDDPAASLLSWVFLAEQERRGHEAKLKVVVCGDLKDALLELFQGESESTIWSIG